MSPNWSVSRKRLPCLRTWTLPRSVAFSIGMMRGSMKRIPSTADSAGARPSPFAGVSPSAVELVAAPDAAFVSRIVTSGHGREPLRLVGHDQRVDQAIDLAAHHPWQ